MSRFGGPTEWLIAVGAVLALALVESAVELLWGWW